MSMILSVAAGALCGVLSGYGVGGGSLLMVLLTAVFSIEQKQAQSINLLYFLPTAAAAIFFHVKHKQIEWRAVLPAVAVGCIGAILGATAATNIDASLLRKLFGGFLFIIGIREIFYKPE